MAGIETILGFDIKSYQSADQRRFVADQAARYGLKWVRKGEIVYQEDTGVRWEYIGNNDLGGHTLPTPGTDWAEFTGGVTSYNDLTDLPTLFSGAYADLSGKPTLFSGAYADLSGKPTLFDGAYASLSGKPTLVTTFLALTDTPAAYVAKALQAANAAGTALENTNIFYDAVNNRMGMNIASPLAKFHSRGSGLTSGTNSFRADNNDGSRSLNFKDDGAFDAYLNTSTFYIKSGSLIIKEDDATAAQFPFVIKNNSNTTVLQILAANGTIYAGGLRHYAASMFRFTGNFETSGGIFNFGNSTSGISLKDSLLTKYNAIVNASAGNYIGAANDMTFLFAQTGANYTGNATTYGNRQYWQKKNGLNIPSTNTQKTIWNATFLTAADFADNIAFGLNLQAVGALYDAGAGPNGTDPIMPGHSGRGSVIGLQFKNSGAIAHNGWYAIKHESGVINLNLTVYADNAAALAGSLSAGDMYMLADGSPKIVV